MNLLLSDKILGNYFNFF